MLCTSRFVDDVMFVHNASYGAWLAGRILSDSPGGSTEGEVMMSTIGLFMVTACGDGFGRVNEVTLRRARLVPGWVTVFGRANHLSISPSHLGQLSLLTSAGRELISSQSAVMLCCRRVKAGMARSTCGWGWG